MVIRSAAASLPVLNPLSSGSLGSNPSTLSTPLSGGTGYSMTDSFEAAPAASGAGYGSTGYGGAGYGSAGVGYGTPAGPAVSGASGAPAQCPEEAGPGGAAGLTNVTGDPQLLQATQEIAGDPVGARLVQAAQAPGLQLQIGALPPGVEGVTQNGTITISPQAASNKPDLIHTLAHELGHAATPNDGDSLTEEQLVDQLGQQIQQRLAPGPTFQLDIGAYQGQGLPQDNGIRNSLAKLGL